MPSLAVRDAFLEALAIPFFRRISSALLRSPSDSTSAFLQSIMPALVLSRNCLTRVGLTSAIKKRVQRFEISVLNTASRVTFLRSLVSAKLPERYDAKRVLRLKDKVRMKAYS